MRFARQNLPRVLRLLLIVLWVACVVPAGATPLPATFKAALAEAGIPLDAVALVVQPVDAARPVLAHQALRPMNPASVMKLVTSLAALDGLGPAYTWKTEVWANGTLNGRVLDGDLVIKGYGDPTLTLERLWLLQRELRARGIGEVRGRLILDTSHFALPALDPGAFDGEPLAAYNAVPAALLVNFNAIPLRLSASGDTVAVVPEFELPGLTIASRLVADDAPCDDWKGRLTHTLPDAAHRELVLEGRFARACGEKRLNLNLLDPAATFDYAFRALWAESGGVIAGATELGTAPAGQPPLLRFESIPLGDALRSLNKYSNNLMTRNLFLTLGAETYGAPATLEKAERAVRAWLAAKGVAAPGLVLENGAGLSRAERIAAATLAQLLHLAYRSANFSEFESALPIAAVDGTLKKRFDDMALAGHAHLKTGTLKDVRALAGYVFDRTGRRVAVVLVVNHPAAERAEPALRALLDWVYAAHAARPARGRRRP